MSLSQFFASVHVRLDKNFNWVTSTSQNVRKLSEAIKLFIIFAASLHIQYLTVNGSCFIKCYSRLLQSYYDRANYDIRKYLQHNVMVSGITDAIKFINCAQIMSRHQYSWCPLSGLPPYFSQYWFSTTIMSRVARMVNYQLMRMRMWPPPSLPTLLPIGIIMKFINLVIESVSRICFAYSLSLPTSFMQSTRFSSRT